MNPNEKQSHYKFSDDPESPIEVWFLIEKDKDGYPASRSWEGLWTRPTAEGFEILSVPFFLKNVSRGDIVFATDEGFLRFNRVVRRNGHNTYRLLVHEASESEVAAIIEELKSKKLTVELNETRILISVDASPDINQEAIDNYLVENEESGRWQMQDGYLGDSE